MVKIPTVLSIAGSDSGGGAGIQADIKTIHACGGFAATAITAVTAQNTREVRESFDLGESIIRSQIRAVLDDFKIDAVKTGMLSSAAIVGWVAEELRNRKVHHLVVDPVMVSTSGHELLAEEAVEELKERLLPLAEVATPNLHEAGILSGLTVRTRPDMEQAAKEILKLGCRAVVVKGGHLDEPEAADLLFDGRSIRWFSSPRVESGRTHGTGCTFSAALATHLALGLSLPDAVEKSKAYTTAAIRALTDLPPFVRPKQS